MMHTTISHQHLQADPHTELSESINTEPAPVSSKAAASKHIHDSGIEAWSQQPQP